MPTQYLPSGLDRGDGLSGRIGTPTPAGAITVRSGDGIGIIPIEEEPDSPIIERGEQCTIRHHFICSWTDANTLIHGLGMGLILEDSEGNVTRLLTATIEHRKGDSATLRTVEESLSFDSPPDEFDCFPVELGINVLKHPRYFYALEGANGTERTKNQFVIRALQDYMENPTFPYRNTLPKLIYDSIGHDVAPGDSTYIPGTDLAKRAALEIIQKYWRNEETPYIAGLQLTWSQYFWRPPFQDLGGYVQDPITGIGPTNPGLPEYFWMTLDGTSFLSKLATVNPQCFSSNGTTTGTTTMSWLRKADQVHYHRTWFKLDRIWYGAAVGYWDAQLYSASARPSVPGDYEAMDPTALPDYRS